MDSMTCLGGVTVAEDRFTDLDYADDIVLPINSQDELVPCLTDFSLAVKKMGLNNPWPKTKIHCSAEQSLPNPVVQGQVVESVGQLVLLIGKCAGLRG